jgi:hypothetical protein
MMAKWKSFNRKYLNLKHKKILYKIEIEGFPDMDVDYKSEATKIVKQLRKMGFRAKAVAVKDGYVATVGGTKFIT